MTSPGYYDLLEMLPQPGCALCRLLQRDTARHLDTLLYEFVLDTKIQGKFRASRGLCNEHGHQLTRQGNVLGIAALYFAAFTDVLDVIDRNPVSSSGRGSLWKNEPSGSGLAKALEPTGVCMTCKFRDENEARYLREISDHLHEEKFFDIYRSADGLCLPHFRALLRVIPSGEQAKRVTAAQRGIWQRLQDELSEFMRKSDFTNVAETMGAEGDSWRRAVARLSGEDGVFGIQHEDD
ncbi:MAG: DUF6062 family protein [Anaerolineae bacterium]